MLEDVQTDRIFEKDVEYPVLILPDHTLKGWIQLGLCKIVGDADDISRGTDEENNNSGEHASKTVRRKQKRNLDNTEDGMG